MLDTFRRFIFDLFVAEDVFAFSPLIFHTTSSARSFTFTVATIESKTRDYWYQKYSAARRNTAREQLARRSAQPDFRRPFRRGCFRRRARYFHYAIIVIFIFRHLIRGCRYAGNSLR